MRAVNGSSDVTSSKDALIPFLQAVSVAAMQSPTMQAHPLADAIAALAKHATEAIQIWQDFDDTEPLHAQTGNGDRIEHWLGEIRTQRLQTAARQIETVVASLATSTAANAPMFDAAGMQAAQARLAAGASPQDAARSAIRVLTARSIQARAATQAIEAQSTVWSARMD